MYLYCSTCTCTLVLSTFNDNQLLLVSLLYIFIPKTASAAANGSEGDVLLASVVDTAGVVGAASVLKKEKKIL